MSPTDQHLPETAAQVRAAAMSRHLHTVKRTLPWLLAVAILWVLFRRVSATAALHALDQADIELFVAALLVAVMLWFWLESVAFARLFSRFNAPLSGREARSLRALTYLLTPINWNVGTAAIVLHLRRSKGVAAWDATSSLLFYGLIDGLVLGGLTLAGLLTLPPSPTIRSVGWIALGFVGLQLCLLGFFMLRAPRWRWERRVRAVRLFRTHGLAAWRDVAFLLTIRCLYFCGFVVFFWVGTRAFNVHVPLAYMAASVPVILMTAGLPITPAGLGTQQAAMLYFFDPYASEAAILAYGLTYPVALMLARIPIGLLYLRDLGALRATLANARSQR